VRHYLLPISDREPLAWIVREQRTAFGDNRTREAQALELGDELFLYTTRGCFRNPTRDRGRVIGRAEVATLARRVSRPPKFGAREYPLVVELTISSLAPLRSGLELAPLIPELGGTFPHPKTWSVRMRRALVPVDPLDATLIGRELDKLAQPYAGALPTYEAIGR
jgi:hypothetical protein